MFTCETCGKTIENKSNFNKHLRIHTDQGQVHECPTCKNKFANRRMLLNHQKTVHSDPDDDFECPTCQKIFKQRENLRRHTKVHMTDKVLHCEYCNQNFTRTDQFRLHQKKCMIPNRKESFICSVSHKNFNSEKILSVHSKLHDDKFFNCHICYKIFKIKGKLNAHLKTHLVKKFKSNDNLLKHQRKHH